MRVLQGPQGERMHGPIPVRGEPVELPAAHQP